MPEVIKKRASKLAILNPSLTFICIFLGLYFLLSPTLSAVYLYKGKIEPRKSTKEQVSEVLGAPGEEIITNIYKYESSVDGIEKFIVEYKEQDDELVVDKMDLVFSKPYKSEVLAESMDFPRPTSNKVNSFGKYQEYFGADFSVIFTHKTKSPESGVVTMSIYNRERFDLFEIEPEDVPEPESRIVKKEKDKPKEPEDSVKTEETKQDEQAKESPKSEQKDVAKLTLEAKQHLQQGMMYVSLARANPNMAVENYSNALLEFSNAIERYPNYTEAYSNRGVIYLQTNKYNLAERDLEKAAELSPDNPYVQYNLAALYSVKEELDLSIEALDKALANGFANYDALRPEGENSDPDLHNLRESPEFKQTLEKHKIFILK